MYALKFWIILPLLHFIEYLLQLMTRLQLYCYKTYWPNLFYITLLSKKFYTGEVLNSNGDTVCNHPTYTIWKWSTTTRSVFFFFFRSRFRTAESLCLSQVRPRRWITDTLEPSKSHSFETVTFRPFLTHSVDNLTENGFLFTIVRNRSHMSFPLGTCDNHPYI